MKQSISMQGIGAEYVTFFTEETAEAVGKVCSITGNETVAVSQNGDKFCGVIVDVKNGVASVQLRGCCEVKMGEAAPALGWAKVAAANGGVGANANGKDVLVYHVDTTEKVVGLML